MTVAGTLRANVTDGTGGRGSLPSSVVLVAEDGHTYTLELPPGWSVDAEAGARVEVSGELAGDGTLRVRRIATA